MQIEIKMKKKKKHLFHGKIKKPKIMIILYNMGTLQRNLIQFLRLCISLALIKISINFYHYYIYTVLIQIICSCKFHRRLQYFI